MTTGPMASLHDQLGLLGVSLAQWEDRDRAADQAAARRAASSAVDAIDALSQELHRVRERLVSEVRAADDAALAHADELLARHRESGRS